MKLTTEFFVITDTSDHSSRMSNNLDYWWFDAIRTNEFEILISLLRPVGLIESKKNNSATSNIYQQSNQTDQWKLIAPITCNRLFRDLRLHADTVHVIRYRKAINYEFKSPRNVIVQSIDWLPMIKVVVVKLKLKIVKWQSRRKHVCKMFQDFLHMSLSQVNKISISRKNQQIIIDRLGGIVQLLFLLQCLFSWSSQTMIEEIDWKDAAAARN